MERGWGDFQLKKANTSQSKILRVFMDSNEHRYNELLEKTGLSTATLSKHLRKLEQQGKIKKEVDVESGKYPYPVLYRLTPDKMKFQITKQELKDFIDDIDNPDLLKTLHLFTFMYVVEVQRTLQEGEAVSHYEIMQRTVEQLMEAEKAHKMIADSLESLKPRTT